MDKMPKHPWYRLHRETWFTMLALAGWLIWLQVTPRDEVIATRGSLRGGWSLIQTSHGWPRTWARRFAVEKIPPRSTGALVTNNSYRWEPEAIALGLAMSLLVVGAPAIVVERWRRISGRPHFTIRSLFVLTLVAALLILVLKHLQFDPVGRLEWYETFIAIIAIGCAIYLAVCGALYVCAAAIARWRHSASAATTNTGAAETPPNPRSRRPAATCRRSPAG